MSRLMLFSKARGSPKKLNEIVVVVVLFFLKFLVANRHCFLSSHSDFDRIGISRAAGLTRPLLLTMLQWMGGSRRKITTQSRKSVQKRQKQYFESRKRQQQQHSSDGMHGFGQNNDESRSLDILGMFDSPAPLTGSTFPGEKDEHSNIHASSVCGGAVTHALAVAINEAGSPLNCQVDAVCQEKEGTDLHGQRENPNGVNVKCPSILDLLGDHPIDGSTEIKPVQEDHVAFSIKGLGIVEAETPNQSPQAKNCLTSRVNGLTVPHGDRALEFITEVLELDGGPTQELNFSISHATLKKKKDFVDGSSFECVKNEKWGLSNQPSHEVCFKRRGINCDGIRCNPAGSSRCKEQKLEFTSWKTLIEDGPDDFSLQSCGSEESCTSSAAREKGLGNSPLGQSSKQARSRGTSTYTCHELGLKLLPDNAEEDENLDSNLWVHEPWDESFATPFVAKPRRNKFLDGFTQLSGSQESKYVPWESERVAHKQRRMFSSRQTVTNEEGMVQLSLEHQTRSPSNAYYLLDDSSNLGSGFGASCDLVFEDVLFGVGMSKPPCVMESGNTGCSGLYP